MYSTIVHMYVCTHKVYKYCINVVNLYVILTHISLILDSVLDEFMISYNFCTMRGCSLPPILKKKKKKHFSNLI